MSGIEVASGGRVRDLAGHASGSNSAVMPGSVLCKKCGKCGSNDIATRWIEAGKHITSSSLAKVENEFVSSSQHDFYYSLKAKKEHLARHCRNCQHEWREKTLDT